MAGGWFVPERGENVIEGTSVLEVVIIAHGDTLLYVDLGERRHSNKAECILEREGEWVVRVDAVSGLRGRHWQAKWNGGLLKEITGFEHSAFLRLHDY